MSHNIEHYDYAENASKEKIQKDLNTYVSHRTWQEGGHGIPKIRWNDVVCESYEEAEKWIESHDSGWYDCLAVKYKEPVRDMVKPVKLVEIEKKISETGTLYHQRSSVLYPKARTSEFIGCQNCGSRLASKYLNTNFCPVCKTDLRPETTLKAIHSAKARWEKAQEDKEEYIKKHSKKEIRWLVKIEYHT
jgi:hypothetical protein